MNQNFILFALLCLSVQLFAQNSAELAEENKLETLRLEAEHPTLIPTPKPNQQENYRGFTDADDDGMDDAWELQHGLDPTNSHDAWWDKDGDQVLNLFEFQLGTDATDVLSPARYEFGPNTPLTDIYNAFDEADNKVVLVRLSEGLYDNFSYIQFYSNNYRIMIQGGWNATFTTYNPTIYRTTFRNLADETIQIGSTGSVQFSAVVLDGIEVAESGDFSLGGGMIIYRFDKDSYTSVYNCRFVDNNHYGFSLIFRNQAENALVFLANTLFGKNPTGGIYTQSTDIASAEWRVYNSTLHNPGTTSEGGVDGLTLDSGNLTIKLNNTINWGNGMYSFNFYSGNDITIDVLNSSVDQIKPSITNYTEFNNINTDPNFISVPNLDFGLQVGSPCLDAGVLLGMPFMGNAPDIGVEDQSISTYIPELYAENMLTLHPNLLSSEQTTVQLIGLTDNTNYQVKLMDVSGRTIWSEVFQTSGNQHAFKTSFEMPTGTYWVVVMDDAKQYPAMPLIIAK